MSQNQVVPLAVIHVQENNFVANAAPALESQEILHVATMSVSILAHMINVMIISQINTTDTVVHRNMVSLTMMALTHTVWIVISQKLRQFADQAITDIRGWLSIYIP